MMKQFAVIGLGAFGTSVVFALAEARCQVVAIDHRRDLINAVEDVATQAVQADARDAKVFRELGLADVEVAIVAIGTDLEASIMATLNCKELGIPLIISKATTTHHGKILEKVGAHRIVYPEGDMGRRLAQTLVSPTIFDHIELSQEFSIEEVVPPAQYINRSLREIELRARFGLHVIGIRHESKGLSRMVPEAELNIAPMAEDRLDKGDTMLVIGKNVAFEKFRKAVNSGRL